jgi:biopolymer transport protein ExbD
MTQTQLPKKHSRTPVQIHTRPVKLWQQDNPLSQEVRIEIVPLIDVIFCILTFFILGSLQLSRQQAITLDLPKASTGTPQMRDMLIVSLNDVGQLYIEKELVTKNQLSAWVKNYHQSNPSGLMVLNASRSASYNEVVGVLDLLRQVGGDRVALATLPGKSESLNNFDTSAPFPNSNGLPSGLPGSYANPGGINTSPQVPTAPGTNPQLPSLPGN